MPTTKRALFVLAAVLLMLGARPAVAQEPSIAEGQLLRVDANAKTLMIRTADRTQMQFIYTDDTKVTGADDSISGLATMTDAAVTVSYIKKQQDNIATKIEVKKTTTIAALSPRPLSREVLGQRSANIGRVAPAHGPISSAAAGCSSTPGVGPGPVSQYGC
jgi:hypothetical protein